MKSSSATPVILAIVVIAYFFSLPVVAKILIVTGVDSSSMTVRVLQTLYYPAIFLHETFPPYKMVLDYQCELLGIR